MALEFTRNQILALCRDVCPNCAASAPLRQRTDSLEWVHDWPGKHTLCLAHHLRLKYKEVLDG